jgi:hypothetical protein
MVLLTKAQAQWHPASCSRVAPLIPPELYTCPCRFYRGAPYPPSRNTCFWSDRREHFPPLKLNYLSAQFFWGFWNSFSGCDKRFAELIEESL